jgi:nicotinate-nucleotide pyrophosphorylase (carboxylating)
VEELTALVRRALEEDIGGGDVTTRATVQDRARARALITQKQPGVIFGLQPAGLAFTLLDPGVEVRAEVPEGVWREGGPVMALQGSARALLAGERTALNFLQRLSGISTLTQAFVAASEGAKLRVTDTRKTSPGMRALEKYAVRVGGGANHRSDLASGILIKDNHIALCGSVREAVRRARANAPHGLRIAVEVDNAAQLDEAIEAGAEVILLDNFQPRDLADAVKRVHERAPRTTVEASGGVTLDRMREISKTGVDVISIGAITHSARAIDFSCEIHPVDGLRASEREH